MGNAVVTMYMYSRITPDEPSCVWTTGDKYGKSGVKSILDKLKINKSAEFNKHCSVFKKTHNEIWNQLPFDAQQLLKLACL